VVARIIKGQEVIIFLPNISIQCLSSKMLFIMSQQMLDLKCIRKLLGAHAVLEA